MLCVHGMLLICGKAFKIEFITSNACVHAVQRRREIVEQISLWSTLKSIFPEVKYKCYLYDWSVFMFICQKLKKWFLYMLDVDQLALITNYFMKFHQVLENVTKFYIFLIERKYVI